MSPEQVLGRPVDRRTDVFAASIVLWEMLAGRALFRGETQAEVLARVVGTIVPDLRETSPDVPEQIEEVVRCGLDPEPDLRFATAREMAQAIERSVAVASPAQISDWLERAFADVLAERTRTVSAVEARSGGDASPAAVVDGVASAFEAPVVARPAEATAARRSDVTTLPERQEPRDALRIAGIASAVVVAAVAAMTLMRAGPSRASGSVAATASALPAVDPAPSVSAIPPEAPASTAAAPPSASAGPARSVPGAGRAVGRPAAARADCSPPYTIDAQGRHHFKLQCL